MLTSLCSLWYLFPICGFLLLLAVLFAIFAGINFRSYRWYDSITTATFVTFSTTPEIVPNVPTPPPNSMKSIGLHDYYYAHVRYTVHDAEYQSSILIQGYQLLTIMNGNNAKTVSVRYSSNNPHDILLAKENPRSKFLSRGFVCLFVSFVCLAFIHLLFQMHQSSPEFICSLGIFKDVSNMLNT